MQFHLCEPWLRPSIHTSASGRNLFQKSTYWGPYLVQQLSTSRTLNGTHIPAKFMPLEGRRPLVQRPGISPHFVPAQWTEGGARGAVNALTAPALNCNSSLKGKGTVYEHVSPFLPISVSCDPSVVLRTPGATWSRPKPSTLSSYQGPVPQQS